MPMIEPGWQRQAKCKELGLVDLPEEDQKPEMRTLADQLFFVGQGGKSGQAQKFCGGCKARRSCLNYAVLYDTKGFWAGTSEAERRLYPPEYREALYEEAVYYNRLETHDVESLVAVIRSQVTDVETEEVSDFAFESGTIVDTVRDTLEGARRLLDGFDSRLSALTA